MMSELTERDHEILLLAARTFHHPGARIQEAHDRFGLSETAFWRRVGELLKQPAAEMAEPVHVHRLQRIRDEGLRRRRAS